MAFTKALLLQYNLDKPAESETTKTMKTTIKCVICYHDTFANISTCVKLDLLKIITSYMKETFNDDGTILAMAAQKK